ncbi:helix-turn-helix domain-containing protein [Lentzea albidocapillata]|uniref:Helix-turn-helix domain-containing protein n=1 Tax=Lentzea albidocapillata TaxID=40571 RepID=A0A1W2FQK9_9PSEU|nr:helix-turn-helix transcriptional regulator [Lentzea albidocapillata]SMD24221.1 Helix-turn-helix domain-containing protein [Lentzea albidocapillata]
MATTFEKRKEEFGERLRKLREAAGLEAKELAARIGWNAPKLSKVENGRQPASEADLEAWLAGMRPPEDVADELRTELAAVHDAYRTWKAQVRGGHKARQELAIELDAKTKVIRAVDVGVVPGLLQTPEYARHVLLVHANVHGGGQDIAEAVRTRMRRQQVLYEPGRTIEILVTESALLHPVAPPDVMAGQIHRLVAAIGTPNVRFGILPAHVRLPYMLMHGYWIVDQVVMVETVTAELRITDPDEVATYGKVTDLLWSAAVEGDAARTLLLRLASELPPSA